MNGMTDRKAKEKGGVQILCDSPLVVNTLATVKFVYTVGAQGINNGGKLRIGLPNVGWGHPLVPVYYAWSENANGKVRRYRDYYKRNTTAKLQSKSDAALFLEVESRFIKQLDTSDYETINWATNYDRFWISVNIEGDDLSCGDVIALTYGDPDEMPLSARVQGFPEEDLTFLVFEDTTGDGKYVESVGSPHSIDVIAGPAARINPVIPSIIREGEDALLRVCIMDGVDVRPTPTPGIGSLDIVSTLSGEVRPCATHYMPDPIGCPNIDGASNVAVNAKSDSVDINFKTAGINVEKGKSFVITVLDKQNDICGTSNPAIVRNDGPNLYFGEFHGQSKYHNWVANGQRGISCNTPRQCYEYARDIAGLDFLALTDTLSIKHPDIWKEIIETAFDVTKDGSFIAFQGTELGDNVNGHRNVVFTTDNPEPPMITEKLGAVSVPELYKIYSGRDDVILIPHHVKMWNNWKYHDPALEPVMEIHSIWGCGEKRDSNMWSLREMTGGAQEAFERGYRFGVIACSDTHAGLPGRSVPLLDRDYFLEYKAGITGIWANDLTRKSLADAVRAKHTYGTTGVRIILEVDINAHPMGSEIEWSDAAKPREMNISVYGTEKIKRISVIKNNEDVFCVCPNTYEMKLCYRDGSEVCSGDFYYVRIEQVDGNFAWSSPIWIDLV